MELLKKTPRIEVVDALRGFAVMAILLVHNLEHFIFPVYPESSPEWLSVLDAGVFNAIFSLFAGKSYAIFALLFASLVKGSVRTLVYTHNRRLNTEGTASFKHRLHIFSHSFILLTNLITFLVRTTHVFSSAVCNRYAE